MPDLNFPDSPETNDIHTHVDKSWKWNGTAWERSAATETGNTEGNTGEVAYYSGKGSIIAGATAFFYDGDKVGIGTSGPTETLDVRGGITASGGLYAGNGATFGGQVQTLSGISCDGLLYAGAGATFGSDIDVAGDINFNSLSSINDGSGNPVLTIQADRNIEIGDTKAGGNDTSLYIRDSHQHIALTASTVELNAATVKVDNTIRCLTDSDTEIVFYGSGGNKIDFISGGITFAGSILHNSVQRLYAPMGITVGHAGGGALGAGNIYTPYGVTCGSLEVGGYWAGEQSTIIGVAIDNGSQVLTTGKKGHRILPWDCEVIEWTVTSTDTGNVSWVINWASYSDWPSTASVGGSGFPTFTGAGKATDTSVNWTKTTFSEGDIMEFEIDGTPTVTNSILFIKIRRTG